MGRRVADGGPGTSEPAQELARIADGAYVLGMERLVEASKELSLACDLEGVMAIVRGVSRQLTGADGATFVLRDGDRCFYADEDAIAPLWKGRRFPAETCISGWVIREGAPAIIPDIYLDDRVPAEAYRPTFVKSLAMVPIRQTDPIGAIGTYWAKEYQLPDRQLALLQALADLTSVAMENVRHVNELEAKASREAELLAEAEAAIRVRDEFLSIASHELKTPLTPLMIQVQILDELTTSLVKDEKVGIFRERLEKIGRQGQRLQRLVDDLLDVSRIMSGRLSLELEELDLAELVRDLCAQQQDADQSSELLVEIPDALFGRWDRGRLEQIVANLLSNARKYGSGKPVAVRLRATEVSAVLQVEDGGIGIGPEDQERIFNRFERAVSSRNYGGLGVGLFVARRFVEAMGGSIAVSSQLGNGSVFEVRLPTHLSESEKQQGSSQR